jgi:hypothetical protein
MKIGFTVEHMDRVMEILSNVIPVEIINNSDNN